MFFCFAVANTGTDKTPEAGVVQIVDVTLEKFAINDIEIHTYAVQHTNTHAYIYNTHKLYKCTII